MGGTEITLLSKKGDTVLMADPLNVNQQFKFTTLPELIRQNDYEIDSEITPWATRNRTPDQKAEEHF